MNLTATNVHDIFMDCLYRDDEIEDIPAGEQPKGFIEVQGVMIHVGLNPDRVGKHRQDIIDMLADLPEQFHEKTGGGWSFLNACMDKNGLPEGLTCDDCVHSYRCRGLLGSSYDGNVERHQCDWAPSRFRQATPEQIQANKPVKSEPEVEPEITADTPLTLAMDVELAITVGYDEPHYLALLARVREAERDQIRYRTIRRLQTSDDLLCDADQTACEDCPVARFCGSESEIPGGDEEVDLITEFLELKRTGTAPNHTVESARVEDRPGAV